MYNSAIRRIIDGLLDGEWHSSREIGLHSTDYVWANLMEDKGILESYYRRGKFYRIKPDVLPQIRRVVQLYNTLLDTLPTE